MMGIKLSACIVKNANDYGKYEALHTSQLGCRLQMDVHEAYQAGSRVDVEGLICGLKSDAAMTKKKMHLNIY